MIVQFGQPCPCTADINGDGVVDTADLGIMVGVFGELCDGCVGAPPGAPESLMAGRGTGQPTPLLDALGFGSVHDYTAWLESLSHEEIFEHLDHCMEIIRAAE